MGKGKGKAKGKGGGFGGDAVQKEEPLQAVLLADSFEQRFRPVTLERPKALLPLANVPLIEYTLEFLAESGVKEIFVVCGWLGHMVEDYLAQSRWGGESDPQVKVLSLSNTSNACHAIREIDGMNILRSDPFVLVSGDVVSNLRLQPALEAHKARRKSKDGGRNNILTMLFSRTDPTRNQLRPLDEELALVLNAKTGQIVKYENDLGEGHLQIQTEGVIDEHPHLQVRYDLLDCNIDICSPEMMAQISENYDYRDLRKDYIRNEVQNRELGYRIHAHELTSPAEYACRVRCLRTYDSISRDVVRRWLYPLVPEANWMGEGTRYGFSRGFKYRDTGVQVARSGVLGEDSVIGRGSVIEEGATVVRSVLGPGCVIGKNAVVRDAYLWGHVSVGEGARVESAVVCNGVQVKAGAVVSPGCVISFNAVIGAGFAVPPFTRVTTSSKKEVDGDSDSDFGDFTDDEGDADEDGVRKPTSSSVDAPLAVDEGVVGTGGFGVAWVHAEDRAAPAWAADAMQALQASAESGPALQFQDVSGSIGCVALEAARQAVWDGQAAELEDVEELQEAEMAADAGAEVGNDDDVLVQFVSELVSGANEAASSADDVEHDNVVLELNGQKFAQNRSFDEMVLVFGACVLGPAAEAGSSRDDAAARLKERLDVWEPTLERLCLEEEPQKALIDAVELVALYGAGEAGLAGLAMHARQLGASGLQISPATAAARQAFPFVLSHLVAGGLVSTEAVQAWASSHESSGVPRDILDAPVTQMVLSQLDDDDDDDDDEDDDEDDDDEDDDDEDDEDDEDEDDDEEE